MDTSGLADERTALAWQRTALAVVAGAAVMARLTFDEVGPLALVLLGTSLGLGLWLVLEASARQSRQSSARRPRGGRAPAVLSTAVALLAATEVVALLVGPR